MTPEPAVPVTPEVPAAKVTAKRFLLGVLLVVTVLLAMVIRPLWVGIFLAGVLASVLMPIQRWLTKRFRGKQSIAAAVMVFAVLALLVGPTIGFSAFIIREGRQGVAFVIQTFRSEGMTGLVARLPDPVEKLVNKVVDRLPQDEAELTATVEESVTGNTGNAASAIGAAMAATGSFLFQLTIMLIAFFFFLVEGATLAAWLTEVMPLLPGQGRELMTEVRQMSGSVVKSTVLTAGVQAVVALIGYFIARVPHPFFFATLTFFLAFIPAIGAGTMCVAAAGLLLATGHTGMAIFLGIWGLVIVGLSDNVVKPMLIKGDGAKLNGGVVFFSLIGGLAAFGTVGLLLGPLVVTLFVAVVRVLNRDFRRGVVAKPEFLPSP